MVDHADKVCVAHRKIAGLGFGLREYHLPVVLAGQRQRLLSPHAAVLAGLLRNQIILV